MLLLSIFKGQNSLMTFLKSVFKRLLKHGPKEQKKNKFRPKRSPLLVLQALA